MPTNEDEPSGEELQEHIEEAEDDRVAAEEAEDIGDEDAAAARDAQAGRAPTER